jgi:hypothetical protein
MGRGGKHYHGNESPIEDQEWYIKENALAIVRKKDEQLCRLRNRIYKLEQGIRSLREELKRR